MLRANTILLFSLFCFWINTAEAAPKSASFEPNPYIVYWGQMEAKLEWKEPSARYEAAIIVVPSDFRLSIQREPRLWTGETILKNVALTIEGVVVETDPDNAAVYNSSRVALDRLAVQADADKSYSLIMQMPDGKKAQIMIGFEVKEVAAEDKEMWKKSGLLKSSIWGEPLAKMTENTEFFTYNQFLQAARHWVQQMVNLPLTSDKAAYISVVPPTGTAYEIEVPRDMRTEEAQRYLFGRLSAKSIVPATQVFFQVRPNGAWVGDFLLLTVLRDDDPMVNRNKYDRRLFGMEWGHYRFELKGYYGSSLAMASGEGLPADAPYDHKETSLSTDDLKAMLQVPFRVWEKGSALEGLRYDMTIGGIQHHVQGGEALPELVRIQIEKVIEEGKTLKISGFQADGMDLRRLSLSFTPKL